jgi:hypothetical protein
MRTLGLLLIAAGCAAATHGLTAAQYVGTVPLTFTNATPERICGLYLSSDSDANYGDNWLPVELQTGMSIDYKVKPGVYKARWSSCKDAKDVDRTKLVATYSAARVHATAVHLSGPTQLYAFVADGGSPTKRSPVKPRYKVIPFEGGTTIMSASVERGE